MAESMGLPDPTADLHWSNYKGAIHDIFNQNALKQPERLCVLETASRTSPERQFSYKQINEASNVLAHHLLKHGVQRGEVVMVYAYRGVDLVVVIMGILKAGAAFSVIDPAYPPDRQNIYLDVARPRALVVIDKASRDAGPLSETVQKFIRENLKLRTTVPAMKLNDDGTLVGGQIGQKDCLHDQLELKSVYPGVVVGPDSIPTLSFTSGSEGRPKGVIGRHFSLTYYFPWMAKTFGLDCWSRFTMLSGIAHDPIQRDVFTPLFLGAHLLVPAKDDIQYEKLADWMREYGATVAHLTPAMGQILVGGAVTEFPHLRNAFFVGDILIRRDCRRLQELAPNVSVINMYGTTETQRSVSYYRIPPYSEDPDHLDSLGEVIPAGQGMQDVQLLVVDREDKKRICEIGEIGEIYVRAGGLAEGYLGLEELTGTKFLSNWFVNPQKWVEEDRNKIENGADTNGWRKYYKGPRDRLYRSGDLGRYRSDGNVECTGRADNQVQIRGFRIELGEIDSHLSQNSLIRENVTLLRRDKYEEQILVSYIIPDERRWRKWLEERGVKEELHDSTMVGLLKRFRLLREDAREQLKKKLPAYAIPTVFVPLIRMPLNPNGKVDKPALPFPEPAELYAATPRRASQNLAALSPTETAVAEIWARNIRSLIARTIRPADAFYDLGGDSSIAQRVLLEVRRTWKDIDISMDDIFRSQTLRSFAGSIDRARDPIGLRLDSGVEQIEQPPEQDEEYSADAVELTSRLRSTYPHAQLNKGNQLTVFLTGATGFLGAYILRDLLSRERPSVKVIAHVRAPDTTSALERVVETCKTYGIWTERWRPRLVCVVGDLEKPRLGLQPDLWTHVAENADAVIHNGARVHWILPYPRLKRANVEATLWAIELCTAGKQKQFAFVSSTSVLDRDYYVELSRGSKNSGGNGVSEEDDLMGSRKGLRNGYGQSKWVSEYLVREAGRRGLRGSVIRPGYVTGDSRTGASNTDDFLLRMLKGCVQLSACPDIENTVNMVPVDHVARVVVSSTFNPPVTPLGVVHVTSHPRLRLKDFVGSLQDFGYEVPTVDYYQKWKPLVERYVTASAQAGKEDFALLPLLHFVTSDLPNGTKAPELDDAHAAATLRIDANWTGEDASAGVAVTAKTVGVYLAYLVAVGFMAPPEKEGKRRLPKLDVSAEQKELMEKVGGRGGNR